MDLHKLAASVWYGRSLLSLLLVPAAWLYRAAAAARKLAFRHGVFATPELPVPVVVVGNISVGGTGKTPVVAWLAAELGRRGYRVGIVSRGYGGQIGSTPHLVKQADTAALVGDEALLLARLTGRPVCICTDRVAAVQFVYQQGVDVVLSDDGLQHYAMQRSFEIAVVDAARGLGNGRMLPAGPLREPTERLRDVNAVLLNGRAKDQSQFDVGSAYTFELVQADAQSLEDNRAKPLREFSGQRVWSVAGIGHPQRFHDALVAVGVQVDPVDVPDHGTVDLAALTEERMQPVLMTQKDAVKYPDADDKCWYVPVTLEIDADEAGRLLAGIEESINSRR